MEYKNSPTYINSTRLSENRLANLLDRIVLHDLDYDKREMFIYKALAEAKQLKLECGIRVSEDPEWPVVFIELPYNHGEVSWHLKGHVKM
jgi:hypothetical protein